MLFGGAAALAFAACSSAIVPSSTPAMGLPSAAGKRAVARTFLPPATADLGRRAAGAPVKVVVLLRFNHARELRDLVARLARTRTRTYLTPAAFVQRYDPTPAQERTVVAALRRAGFHVTHRYADRLLIDAVAPSATVERFFSTTIHSFSQGRYGVRFANVRPLRIPPTLARLVKSVDADNVIRMHPGIHRGTPLLARQIRIAAPSGAPGHNVPIAAPIAAPPAIAPRLQGVNVIGNPGFESGRLPPWKSCKTTKGFAAVVVRDKHAHSGHFDAYAGSFRNIPYEPNGLTSVCQLVTVPTSAVLTIWTAGVTNDHLGGSVQFGGIYTAKGKLRRALYVVDRNDTGWIKRTFKLNAFANQRDYIAFGVVGNSQHTGKYIGQYVDDASLIGPTPVPTATPTISPTMSPTPAPSTSPTPTSSPVVTPTPIPSTTPAAGPSYGPDQGWGPGPVIAGFALPYAYGYAGAGQTAAIVIDATVRTSDLSAYLAYYGITQTGSVTNEAVDGGAGVDNDGEATLDLETIVSLAPAANVIVYDIPNLSDQDIEDAYNQVLSDKAAFVVNSSFGGCEAGDPAFTTATESIAQQGAATGITFSASSGDQGSGCYNGSNTTYPFGVSAPASGPDFVAVGGTESVSPAGPAQCVINATAITSPVVWSDCVGAGGGGVSTVWTPAPSNQSGIAGVTASGRNVPDISLPAAFDDTYFNGNWNLVWGTSWASPIYVAMQTEINQTCERPLWGIDAIYNAFKATGYNDDFLDVTSGNDFYQTPRYYNAGPGFDQASGIGMPLGIEIAADNGCVSRPALGRSGERTNAAARPH